MTGQSDAIEAPSLPQVGGQDQPAAPTPSTTSESVIVAPTQSR
jgi:hypothetical protein